MFDVWFNFSLSTIGLVILSSVGMIAVSILVIRVIGLRSLSKMSSFDFLVTVGLGSVMATTAATTTSFWNGAVAMAALLATQWVVSTLRRRTPLESMFDNTPTLLMLGDRFIDEHLDRVRVSESDVRAKLREANVTDMDQVLAVVLETTGDVSVLHGEGPLDPALLEGVRGAERLPHA